MYVIVCVDVFVHRVFLDVSMKRVWETSVEPLSASSKRRRANGEEFSHIEATPSRNSALGPQNGRF